MVKEELIQRSPVRVFMNSIHGGLKPGELGLVASPSGIGKTSVLVQIALDKLLQDKKVIHISFTKHTDYVLAWYENIFDEFIKKKNLENEQDVKNDIVKNRVLMKFAQGGITNEQIVRSLRALIKDGGFNADVVIVDGYDFSAAEKEHLSAIKSFAGEMGLSAWYSCNINSSEPLPDQQKTHGLIKSIAAFFEVVIELEPKKDHIALTVSRDRDGAASAEARDSSPVHLALKLDPRTLMILEN